MPRHVLDEAHIHPAIRAKISERNRDLVDAVRAAVAEHDVVVVGMSQNPHPKKARKLLDARGTAYRYLGYGGYHNLWRRRTALKMWTGWGTFPMIFVKGTFIGGASDLAQLAESGELDTMLAADRAQIDAAG